MEDSGEDLSAGKRKYNEDAYADNNGGVEGLSALAFGDVLADVEKDGDVSNRVNYGEKGQYWFDITHIRSAIRYQHYLLIIGRLGANTSGKIQP